MKTHLTILLVAALPVAAGCVDRELFVTSEPEGALVRISDRELGRTPVTTPFTWYGDYEIIMRLDGYETLTTSAKITPRWYEVPPLDLLSELAPWRYYDRRELSFKLTKLVEPTDEELIQRAQELQAKNLEPAGKEDKAE